MDLKEGRFLALFLIFPHEIFNVFIYCQKPLRFWGLTNTSGAIQEHRVLLCLFEVAFLSQILENILRHFHCALFATLERI